MRKLDEINIKGFKSIKELDLDLNDLNVLIGPNAVGKSNFISLFTMFNNLVKEQLQNYVTKSGGADSILHYGSKVTEEIFVDIYFGPNAFEVRFAPTENDQLMITKEVCKFYNKTAESNGWFHEVINEGGTLETNLFKSKIRNWGPPQYVREALENWKVYHFHDTSDSAKVKKTSKLHDNRTLNTDASNLAAYLYKLKKKNTQHFELIEETVKQIVPFFGGFNLHPDELNPESIRLEWKEKDSDKYFDAHSLSDGTLRFICLTTLLLQPKLPSTIIIDEPELGLHPYAITVLASVIRKASKRSQLIISTQSVNLVNEFYPEEVIVVDRIEQQSEFKRLDSEELENWLEQYSLGEIWEKNLIGGRP